MESPEFDTGGGGPDVGVTGDQAFDRVWEGVVEQDFNVTQNPKTRPAGA